MLRRYSDFEVITVSSWICRFMQKGSPQSNHIICFIWDTTCGAGMELPLHIVLLVVSTESQTSAQRHNVPRIGCRAGGTDPLIASCAPTVTVLCLWRSSCSPLTSTLSGVRRRRGSAARASPARSRIPPMTHTHQRSERKHKRLLNKRPGGSVKKRLIRKNNEQKIKTFLSPCFRRRRPGL